MVDNLTPMQRRHAMQSVPRRNTAPEILLRRRLHARGLRFRLHRTDLPGTPDIVFPQWKAVVFVHGCFWHGHNACGKGTPRSGESDYWREKRIRNRRRDAKVTRRLRRLGWRVKVVWECAVGDPQLAAMIDRWLRGATPAITPASNTVRTPRDRHRA